MIATRDAGGRYTECRSGSIASSFADPAQSSERVPNCACPAEMRLHSGSLGRNGPERVAGGCLLFSAWSTVLSGRHRLQVCLPTAAPLHWKLLQNISRCAWVPYQLPAACLPACSWPWPWPWPLQRTQTQIQCLPQPQHQARHSTSHTQKLVLDGMGEGRGGCLLRPVSFSVLSTTAI